MEILLRGIKLLSQLMIDSDLDMGAQDITLGVGQTVDGIDISAKHANTTKKKYFPVSAFSGAASFSSVYFSVLCPDALDKVYGSVDVPADYVGSGVVTMRILKSQGTNPVLNEVIQMSGIGESINAHSGTNNAETQVLASQNVVYEKALGSTCAAVVDACVIGDEIRLEITAVNADDFVMMGFVFTYEGTN